MSEKPISDLRRRMLEDMAVRKFGEKTQPRLYPPYRELRQVPRPLARHGNGGGRAPLPGASDRERCAAADAQQLGLGAALLLRHHAGSCRAGPASRPRALPEEAAARAFARGGGPSSRSGARPRPEVQGGARASPMAPALQSRRGHDAARQRYRLQAHADPGRTGQGPAKTGMRCSRRSCSSSCARGGCSAARKAGCSRAAIRCCRSRHGS